MMLQTERLIIIPLTYSQVQQYLANDQTLETGLGVGPSGRKISPELEEALRETVLPGILAAGDEYYFSTLWTIISKTHHQMVGDLCFTGAPDQNGQIELGYGTYEAFHNQGIMTEAVAAVLIWAKHQAGVKSVMAHTSKDNPASFKVLIKNDFTRVDESAELIEWKLVF